MFACPSRDREIATEDLNVATDIALCRACGGAHRLSELHDTVRARHFDASRLPGTLGYSRQGTREELVHHAPSWLLIAILSVFLLVWGGLSIGGIYIAPLIEGNPRIEQVLLGLPFLIGSLAMLCAILVLAFGKFKLVVDGPTSHLGWGALGIGRLRAFDATRIASVHLVDSKTRSNGRALS